MNNIQNFIEPLSALAPELCVIAAILFACLWNLFQPRAKDFTAYFSLSMLILASMLLCQQLPLDTKILFGGVFSMDRLTVTFSLLSCLVGILIVLLTMGYESKFGNNQGEFYACVLTAVLSVMVLSGATDLIMLFVALETLTICCVLLSGFNKADRKSNEAALKYLLSTAATTATFLYGLSLLYGLTGTTLFYGIQAKMATLSASTSMALILIVILLISVVGFKLSLVPFHMWTPDVYEGAPTPVTAYLSIGSKLGGLVVAIRLLVLVFGTAAASWTAVIGVLAIVSMVMGNIIALAQTSFKRMLAYSSIAHVGYMLIGLTVSGMMISPTSTVGVLSSIDGLSALIFYAMVYGLMNIGAFAGAILVSNETGSDKIDDMAGLIKKRPWLAIGLSVCLLNLAGLPVPPAGFFAKFFVFSSAFQLNTTFGYWMVAAGLLTSLPALYYYTRVVIKMVVQEPTEAVLALPDKRRPQEDSQSGPVWALAIVVAGILAASIMVNPLMNFSMSAISSVGKPAQIGYVPRVMQ